MAGAVGWQRNEEKVSEVSAFAFIHSCRGQIARMFDGEQLGHNWRKGRGGGGGGGHGGPLPVAVAVCVCMLISEDKCASVFMRDASCMAFALLFAFPLDQSVTKAINESLPNSRACINQLPLLLTQSRVTQAAGAN